MFWALLLWTVFPARASEGPWTTSPGLHNIYLGLMGERFQCFEADGARPESPCDSGLPTNTPVAQVGAKIFYRTGLTSKTDVAIGVPMGHSFSTKPTSNPQYESTTGLGLIQGRIRRRLGSLGDVGFAAGAGLQTGALHHSTRGRYTNLGEGSTDLTGTLYIGSTGLVLRRFHTTSMDLSYAYRLPQQVDSPVGRIPGDEIHATAVSLLAVSSRLGVGLSADGAWRLWGEQLTPSRLGVYGDDRWAALAAAQVKLGGRIVIYPGERSPYLQLSAMRAVWARNNPLDTTQLEIAMGMDLGRRR
jgi:hypothetical protein